MRRLGVHTSIAGGLHLALHRAHDLGCTTLQIFSHNPRSWSTKEIAKQERSLFKRLRKKLGLTPVYVHASYLINIASPLKDLMNKSIAMLEDEMMRADLIGADYVVLHAGSAHDVRGMDRAVDGIHRALGGKRFRSRLLIENTSGKRGDFTSSIPALSRMMKSSGGLIYGVCIDSCHAFAAGYDIRKDEGLQKLVMEIDKYVGKENIRLIHLNDSKGFVGSGVDRHEHIGMGNIGKSALKSFLSHPFFIRVPVILETPKKDSSDDMVNISMVKGLLL